MVDVIIIGAGVIGCSTALALSRRGYKTLNIDRLPAAGYGSTSYSSAVVRPYYSSVESTMLAYEGHFIWQDWRNFLQAPRDEELSQYVQCGSYQLKTAENNGLADALPVLDAVGVPYTHVSAERLRTIFPDMELASFYPPRRVDCPDFGETNGRGIEGALYFPTAGYINDPQLTAKNLFAAAYRLGAQFRFNADIVGIRQAGGRVLRVVLSDGEQVDAPFVVNVAGPHSAQINEMAGVVSGMKVQARAMRTEVVHLPTPGMSEELVIADSDTGVYFRSAGRENLLVGSLEPACDKLDWTDPDTVDSGVTEQWTNQAWRAALRFPALPIPNQARGYGAAYDVTPDWTPIYDKSDLEGFFMAIGTSGNQFKNAPLAGEIMADLIDHAAAGRDHDAMPAQRKMRHSGHTLNIGFFSRNRAINTASTNSVIG